MERWILFNENEYIELPTFDGVKENPGTDGAAGKYEWKGNFFTNCVHLPKEKAEYDTGVESEIHIGTYENCHIVLSAKKTVLLRVKDGVIYMLEGKAYINGKRCRSDSQVLQDGDGIFAGGILFTWNEERLFVCGEGYQSRLNRPLKTFTLPDGFPVYKKSPRIIKRVPDEQINIVKPDAKEEKRKGEMLKRIAMPLSTLAMTVLTSILLKRGIFVIASAGTMVVAIVFSITSAINAKKESEEKERKRKENYEKYLLRQRKRLHALRCQQEEALRYHYPDTKDIGEMSEMYSGRIYERSPEDADFLTVSLGQADMQSAYSVKFEEDVKGDGEEMLYKEALTIANEFAMVKNMPVVIDLKKSHLGLVGEKKYIHRMIQALVPQICFLQSYHDVEILLFTKEEDIDAFTWMKWYPHLKMKSMNVSGLLCKENHTEQVLAGMTQILKERRMKVKEEKKENIFLPHFIFIIDEPKLVINHSVMEYLQSKELNKGVSIVYCTTLATGLPENVKTILQIEGAEYGTLLMQEGDLLKKQVLLENTDEMDLERLSRKLAALQHSKGVSNRIPESITFFDMYKIKSPNELDIRKFWNTNHCYKSMAVPLGVRAQDDIVYLNLHEKAHGPHGLVAGTTGSGKSEILQSFILSLAVNFHPYEIGFLLIDYKGGGMANLFADLPHLLGTITNLDGSESLRALASIKSELARRQRIFNETGVNNINDYSQAFLNKKAKSPLPHLILISDEFAELKAEQPEFMAELVSTARIGRSLGVHLILATQKPSGVVDDQIWSNSKFKLALKVQNASDSNEIIKTPDAAQITQPGRAYLQVGNNEIYELFQSAWSGAKYSEEEAQTGFDERIYTLNAIGQRELVNAYSKNAKESKEGQTTQLDAMVKYIKNIYESEQSMYIERPWLPSLEKLIVSPHLDMAKDVGKIEGIHLRVPIGIVDIPEEQKQEEYIHDFQKDGNLAIFGSGSTGKSTAVMNVILTLAAMNSPVNYHSYILDFGNSSLVQMKKLPHTADYLTFDDMEKLNKLVTLLTVEIKRRKQLFARESAMDFAMYNEVAKEKLPAIVLFLDNYDVVKELEMELEPFLIKLSRDGAGIGIYMMLSATRSGAVRYSMLSNFRNKIALYMVDQSEVGSVVGRTNYKQAEIKGRGMVKLENVNILQCYRPVEGEGSVYVGEIERLISELKKHNSAPNAKAIRVMPEYVSVDMLYQEDMTIKDCTARSTEEIRKNLNQKHLLPVGIDAETITSLYLEVFGNMNLVLGKPQSGKTNVLAILSDGIASGTNYIFDPKGDIQKLTNKEGNYIYDEHGMEKLYQAITEEIERRINLYEEAEKKMRLRDFCFSMETFAVLIDEADLFIEFCSKNKSAWEKLLPKAMEYGIAFVASAVFSKLRGFDDLTRCIKEAQSGVVLGAPDEQSVFRLPVIRNYRPQIDVGFVYCKGVSHKMRIPQV